MKVRFVKTNGFGSDIMRGDQIAHALKQKEIDAEAITDPSQEKDSILVFIKNFDPVVMRQAKANGNTIVFDPVDKFSKKDVLFELSALNCIDHVIWCTSFTQDYFQEFINMPSTVIYHHWDPRVQSYLGDWAKYPYTFRVGYLGAKFNHTFSEELADVMPVYHPNQWCEWAGFFTMHYNVREPGTPDYLFKPATKCSNAAAVNANIITTPDPATIELLGENYPYYVKDYSAKGVFEVIKRASENFEEEEWYEGLSMMKNVRDMTAIDKVADDYIKLFQELSK